MKGLFALISIFLIIQTGYTQDTLKNVNEDNSRIRINRQDPDNFDVKLFRSINNNRSNFLNTSLTITDFSVLPAAVILPAAMFAFSRAKNRTYDENSAVLIAISEGASVILTAGLKYIVKRPRPYKTLSNVHLKKGILGDLYSFPSGHTATAFSMATSLVLRYPKYPLVYIPAYLYGFIVGYGRVYFGMHYPGDVLGGAVLGSLSAIGVYSLRNEIFKFKNRVLGEENKPDVNNYDSRSIGVISLSFITAIVANGLISSNNIEIYPAVNSLKEFNCFVKVCF